MVKTPRNITNFILDMNWYLNGEVSVLHCFHTGDKLSKRGKKCAGKEAEEDGDGKKIIYDNKTKVRADRRLKGDSLGIIG